MDVLPPQIPNFILTERCGAGASGEVWLGTDHDGIRRAIRLLDRSRRSAAGELRAIALYRNIARQQEHLLDILYIGETSRYLYCVTPAADNLSGSEEKYLPDTLSARLGKRSFSKAEVLETMEGILEGLKHLHKHGAAHHDLKPENILYVGGKLKIGDPGLLKSAEELHCSGTPEYSPYWQCSGIEADLYAAGKILYVLYSGNPPEDFPLLPENFDFRSYGVLNEIALHCCSAVPEERFCSASRLLGVLRKKTRPERACAPEMRHDLRFLVCLVLFLFSLFLNGCILCRLYLMR